MSKTLADYIKGYPFVPVLLIAEHKSKGSRYMLCKEEGHDAIYFMKDEEVLDKKWLPGDRFEKLAIAHINNKRDQEIISEIKQQPSYKAFVKFVKEQTGEDFII